MRYQLRRVIEIDRRGAGALEKALRGICVDDGGRVWAVGDSRVLAFEGEGELVASWETAGPAHCIAVGTDGRVQVGEPRQIETFEPGGGQVGILRDGERLRFPTSVATHDDYLLVGDSGTRAIHRYDREGKFVNTIGRDNRTVGFMIPNSQVDFVVNGEGIIHAVNPGKHRVERYTLEGKLLGHMGRFTGTNPEGFSGCCNPTNVALRRDGRVVVTVKAPPAVKIYDPGGKLLEVMGTNAFDPGSRNMDVAVDAEGTVYVIDPVRRRICVFSSGKPAATATGAVSGEGARER